MPFKLPYGSTIKDIARTLGRTCFTSTSILPAINEAQVFARSYKPVAPTKAFEQAFWTLDYWRKRLEAQKNKPKTYCPGPTWGLHWKVVKAITKPYIEAAGQEARAEVLRKAYADLIRSLRHAPVKLLSKVGAGLAIGVPTGLVVLAGLYVGYKLLLSPRPQGRD